MVSFERIARALMKRQRTLKELGVDRSFLLKMKESGYNIKSHSVNGTTYYYISVFSGQGENYVIVSSTNREEREIKWLELSDIHAGSKQFDEKGLRFVLETAAKRNYEHVHISGDLTDGCSVYSGQMVNLRYWTAEEQANLLAGILRDYPLKYYAIHGNHDFSYEKSGGINPLYIISQELGRRFVYIRSFSGDLVIEGILKRMVHLAGGICYAKSYPAQIYIRNLLDSHNEVVSLGSGQYRLQLLQCGHNHFSIAFESAGIYITQPGNFQLPNEWTIRKGLVGPQGGRLTHLVVQNGKILEYNSNFLPVRR